MFSDKQNLEKSVVSRPALYFKGDFSGREKEYITRKHKEIKAPKIVKYGKTFQKKIRTKRQKYKSIYFLKGYLTKCKNNISVLRGFTAQNQKRQNGSILL